MFMTHRDDVAEHEKLHERFGCRRIIHRADSGGIQAEQLLDGQEPVELDKDLIAIPVPGHTRGHVVLLYRNKFLFTGDHLAWSDKRGGLVAFRDGIFASNGSCRAMAVAAIYSRTSCIRN
jgi:glyoxylase-like metal-dependent hydrolase (beta-lactamase superfamily II)